MLKATIEIEFEIQPTMAITPTQLRRMIVARLGDRTNNVQGQQIGVSIERVNWSIKLLDSTIHHSETF